MAKRTGTSVVGSDEPPRANRLGVAADVRTEAHRIAASLKLLQVQLDDKNTAPAERRELLASTLNQMVSEGLGRDPARRRQLLAELRRLFPVWSKVERETTTVDAVESSPGGLLQAFEGLAADDQRQFVALLRQRAPDLLKDPAQERYRAALEAVLQKFVVPVNDVFWKQRRELPGGQDGDTHDIRSAVRNALAEPGDATMDELSRRTAALRLRLQFMLAGLPSFITLIQNAEALKTLAPTKVEAKAQQTDKPTLRPWGTHFWRTYNDMFGGVLDAYQDDVRRLAKELLTGDGTQRPQP